MVNGILQWIRRVFRLKPFQIKLTITRTVFILVFVSNFEFCQLGFWHDNQEEVEIGNANLIKRSFPDYGSKQDLLYLPTMDSVFTEIVVKKKLVIIKIGTKGRGRKNGAIEKVVERRQRKTIKNRESAARSRARKQVLNLKKRFGLSHLIVTIHLLHTGMILAYSSVHIRWLHGAAIMLR
ncbi:putative transcription factor bZIP family [Helianthus annuus]|nr:putative transcription factor bZIP family [Helianthus annuus]